MHRIRIDTYDGIDPVYIENCNDGRGVPVHIRIGDSPHQPRYAHLSVSQARAIAHALLLAAELND